MAAHFPIRAVGESEFDAFHRTNEHAFHDSPPSERHRAEMLDRLELDRTLAAFDGATPVGQRRRLELPDDRPGRAGARPPG